LSDDLAPTAAGWYPLPQAERGGRKVGYWDGAAWSGAKLRAGLVGSRPRDTPGKVALILLGAACIGSIVVSFLLPTDDSLNLPVAIPFAMLFVLSPATPLALAASIVGLHHGRRLKFKTPLSLTTLIMAILGLAFLALSLAVVVISVLTIRL
jgi:hypothetical protein